MSSPLNLTTKKFNQDGLEIKKKRKKETENIDSDKERERVLNAPVVEIMTRKYQLRVTK